MVGEELGFRLQISERTSLDVQTTIKRRGKCLKQNIMKRLQRDKRKAILNSQETSINGRRNHVANS